MPFINNVFYQPLETIFKITIFINYMNLLKSTKLSGINMFLLINPDYLS